MVLDSNQLVEIITEKINTIVVIINPLGEITYVSHSVERILGYKPEELLGEYWWKATRKNDSSALTMLEQFKTFVRNQEIEELSKERMLLDKSNQQKWISWNSSFDENGNVISVGYDITKRKKNEKKLARSLELLKNKNKEIVDSLNYALSIQQSILPNKELLSTSFSDYAVFYQPKDIVSGDFYFIYEFNNLLFVACIDCTGHGVPGALVTVLANNLLKNVIKHQLLTDPAKILHALDQLLYDEFNTNKKVKRSDGMDIGLCVINREKQSLSFSGAHHSLLVKKEHSVELMEFKGNRFPIGLFHDVQKVFDNVEISYEKGDRFFLYSDGITDQFGGQKDKKFTKKRLLELLHLPEDVNMISHLLKEELVIWRGAQEQTDDMLFIALQI